MASNYFPTLYQEFIYKSRYSRYLQEENRREDWPETIGRYFDFFQEHLLKNHKLDINTRAADEGYQTVRQHLEDAVLSMEVMASMRGLMTAGEALKRDEAAIYNCAYLPIDSLRAFDEELYTLMLGTGVGYSVEYDFAVANLPVIADRFEDTDTTIVVRDSKIGWAKSYRELVSLLVNGQVPKYDTSKVRKKGSRLKTFGGRASGPEPLIDLFEFTIALFRRAAGRRLTTLEAHDIACKIADIVVVGGVRRSALISLSDLGDDRLRTAKSGAWWNDSPHRRLANNSAIYEDKPDIGVFLKEWLSLYESKSGERGIFSRAAAKKIIEHSNKLRQEWFGEGVRLRDPNWKFGSNPCSEIILRPYQFCNLTSVQIRPTDTLESLVEKVRIATILGTFQSTLTNFRYLHKEWKKNSEDERLLGVSLNGIFDNALTNGKLGRDKLIEALQTLRKTAIETNIKWAAILGIQASTAITAIKPEGTTSAMNGTSSGIHPAHSPFYIRYVRNDKKDPVTDFMISSGIPYEVDAYDPNNMIAFKFPMKASPDAIFRKDITAIEHLELWKLYQIHYCEHKPSVTISVAESEWFKVGAWVYENFDWISGVSFLPHSDHVYTQAPFTDCTEEQYEALLAQMPTTVDWSRLPEFEKVDTTTGTQTLACTGSSEGCFI